MTNTTKLIAKLAVAIGLIGSLAFSAATPSLARSNTAAASANAGSHYYEPGDNGSTWSFYPGYTDNPAGASTAPRQVQRHVAPTGAFAQAPVSQRSNAPVDDPPGSRFQDEGNSESMGCPC